MRQYFRYLIFTLLIIFSLFGNAVSPAYAASLPAEINKQFTPLQIDAGGVSVLRVTIFNPNTFPLTNASWTDNLAGVQPGLSIANPANVVNTCGGVGDVTAVPGTTNLALSNGTVPAQVGATPGECYVEVNVTSVTPGNLINTIPANNLNADGNDGGTPVVITNTTPASATITVIAVAPPTLAKGFSPNTIFVGGISRLTITVNNNDGDTNLTGTSFTDTLPAGLVLASSVNATVTGCGGGYSLTANPGGTTIALTNATVTPSTNCVVAVDVTGATGTYTNTIPAGPGGPGSIVTDQGVTNASPASSNLNIQPMGLIKAFSPDSIVAGGTSTLTITLQNPTGSAYTGVDVTDNLPTGLEVSGMPTTTCVGGTITSDSASVTLTDGTVPASATPPTPPGTCTITVTVFSPLTTLPATLTNTIPANSVSADQPGVTNYFPATDTIAITAPLTGAKAYSPTTIPLGGVSTVTITLNNNSATNLTNVNFTDVLPANLTVSGTPSSPQCGGTITNTATSVTLAGGSIAAGTSCTIVFNVTSSVPGSGTTYENTIPANNITTAQGVGNSTTIRTGTDLTVVNSTNLPVGVNKAFNTSPIVPGQPTRLRITITAPADTNLTGLSISDTLPTGLVIVGTGSTPPAPANPSENCTGGTLVAPIGGNTITLSGASIDAGTSCRIDVYVTSSTPGIYNNTIPANTITTTEGRTNTADSNTATVRVTSMSMSKAFYSDIVQANGISTLTITLENTMDSPLTNVSVTDNLPGSVTNGIVVAPIPNASTTCGSGVITATAGTQTISMSGGTIPAQVGGIPGICTITVNVQGRDSTPASPSTFTNTIPITNVSGTVQSTGTVINPAAQAQDDLRIQPLTIGVVKGFNPVLVYGGASSTLSIQLINPNNAPLVGIQFTDDMTLLGTGMVIANPANLNVGTCGGSISGNPGDTSFTFTGGTLPPNTNCTLTLSVTMQVNGNLTNLIPAGAVTTLNGVSSPDPTQASLTNLPGVSVSKTFSPATVLANQVSTLTITITNTSLVPVVNMGVADNLPGALPTGLAVANPANAVNNCGGTLTAVPGSQNIQLSGGGLQPFGSPGDVCTISVDVISTEPGVYINTIPAGTLTADGGVTNNDPATDTLTVNPSFSLGNRVWFDTDNSATINGAEIGIDGVDVELYRADGTLVGTQTTANGGYYRFDNLPAGDYFVVIPASEFGTGGTLDGYLSSSTSIAANGTISETTAPDPDDNVDSDDNGTLQTSGTYSGGVISSQITLGPTANEPTDDTDADPTNPPGEASNTQSNRSVDFGFYRQTLGNQIYIDVNNNGTYDAGDTALAGAIVQLFASDGVTEINVGPDGILGTADDASGGVTTGVGGTYLFSGLPAGDYIVRVTPPAGYASTIDTANSSDTTDPDDDIDNNDNGIGTGLGQASSAVVTLTPGSAGVSTTVDDSTGTTANPSLDFGFTSNSGFTKTIVSTDASHTSGLDVAIGEIITYRITIDLPLGITFNNTTITDQLDLGLAFVDCLSVMVQGVDQTATVCPPAVTPAVGTSANPAEDGRQAVFTLPTPITATTSNEQIVIEYRAIVLDVIENQEGVDLNNSVTWAWQGGSVTTSAPDVEIVEPDMQISKSATPVANVPIGTPIQFTLVIDHTTPQSETDAFDVIVTDVLPANLQYIPCSATFAGLAPTSHTASCPAPTSNLTFVWDVFPLGQTATITFNAYLLGTPAINSASVAWTSLPIDPQVNGDPVQLSPFNTESTERFYDPLDAVNIYSVSDSVTINGVNVIDDDNSANLPSALPLTGFAPNVVTEIPQQPKEKAYTATDVWLEIPSLGVNMPIVGVPLLEEDWDVTWLWKEAGWLEGTAFPGWQGNSGLTGHVTLPNGEDGPFAKLGELEWGDKIIVHAYDSLYTYEVQKTVTVSPYNMTVLGHKDDAWLTLITCESYNEGNNTYAKRIAVQAVLLKVSQNKKPYVPAGIH
ncbi:MAG: CnaB domain-containing protein [Chloroflexi bacterium OLB14]|nr:MAG: CnaB domain-containing protein [Chloroflexi bacterium OLB14]